MRVPPEAGERLAAVFGARGLPVRERRAERADPPTIPLPTVRARSGGSLAERVATRLGRFVPGSWLTARVDPGRPGATALALVAAAAALVAAVGVWSDRPRAEPVDALPTVDVTAVTAAGPGAPAAAPGVPAAGPLVVSVVGKVRTPGLVQVADGARVADVLAAAGGALPGVDVSALNLARRVADGEQVAVGVAAAPDAGGSGPVAAPSTPGGAAAGAAGPVDLNRATVAQLDALPGVGPVTAERILQWRTRNGRFSRIEQLREIEGIGERRFGQLRGLVTVS